MIDAAPPAQPPTPRRRWWQWLLGLDRLAVALWLVGYLTILILIRAAFR